MLGIAREVFTHRVSSDDGARLNLDAQHVRRVEEGKMAPNRVHPDAVGELGVAHADMARDALGEADASPVPEDGGHVQDDVLAVLLEGLEMRNTWAMNATSASRQQCDGIGGFRRYSPLSALGPKLRCWSWLAIAGSVAAWADLSCTSETGAVAEGAIVS